MSALSSLKSPFAIHCFIISCELIEFTAVVLRSIWSRLSLFSPFVAAISSLLYSSTILGRLLSLPNFRISILPSGLLIFNKLVSISACRFLILKVDDSCGSPVVSLTSDVSAAIDAPFRFSLKPSIFDALKSSASRCAYMNDVPFLRPGSLGSVKFIADRLVATVILS